MARQTQEQLRALLTQRVTDIYSGASGESWDGLHEGDQYASPDVLSRVIPALRDVFGESVRGWWVYGVRELARFENIPTAVEHLWENGVRPHRKLEPEVRDGE